jgi:ribosomal protein S18 acetylase RimI-like enzyme
MVGTVWVQSKQPTQSRMPTPSSSRAGLPIRRAEAKDAGLLAQLGALTFRETFAADNSAEDMDAYLASAFGVAQQASELADPNSTIYIAERNGVAVGYAMLRSGSGLDSVTGAKPIELVRLYVSREQIGLGVGAALMERCISEASRQGYQTMWLGVWEHNHRAQVFYRKWNFRAVGTHTFQLGQDAQTDLVMARSLSDPDPH